MAKAEERVGSWAASSDVRMVNLAVAAVCIG